MSASNLQSTLATPESHQDLVYDGWPRSLLTDPGIDDPVNDTGVGPLRGDLEISKEFAGLKDLIYEGIGEFS